MYGGGSFGDAAETIVRLLTIYFVALILTIPVTRMIASEEDYASGESPGWVGILALLLWVAIWWAVSAAAIGGTWVVLFWMLGGALFGMIAGKMSYF